MELMPRNESRVVRFSVFEVDLRAGEIRKNGVKVKLQNQPFQILAVLLEHHGEIVTREELRARLWSSDTFVDFDNGLNSAIRRLRDGLGDSAGKPQYVETVGRRGYRFIAAVEGLPTSGVRTEAAPERSKLSSWQPWIGLAVPSAIVIAVIAWGSWRYPLQRADVTERRPTANSLESSVNSAAVSPDGKHLAYADVSGVYWKVISTGETHPLPLPPSFFARVDDWFTDGSNLLLSRIEEPGRAGLWSVSVFGGSPRKLADDAWGGSVSPDGGRIAFRRSELTYDGLWGREEWIMRSDGTDQLQIAASRPDGSQVGRPTWSPDGKRVAYIRSNWAWNARTSFIEITGWETRSSEKFFSDSRLSPALHWLPNGRLIYAL